MSEMVGEDTQMMFAPSPRRSSGTPLRHGNLGEDDKILVSGTVDDLRDVVRIEIEQPTPLAGALATPSLTMRGSGWVFASSMGSRRSGGLMKDRPAWCGSRSTGDR
jgi:hypothetical protein